MPRLIRKYRENPFFRTTVNVVVIQTVLVLLLTLVFAAAIFYQQHKTIHLLNERIAARATGQTFPVGSLANAFQDVGYQTLGSVLAILVLLGSIFGIITSRYALSPTRNSLQFQKRFIGNVAHELRTPLSIIRTNTEVAQMDPQATEYSQSTFSTTIEELDRVSSIINNLLSFDSLVRPGSIRFEPISLREAAVAVVARHKEMAESYGIALALDAAEDPAHVLGNQVAIEQVLTNLLKNALNYTPQHDNRNVIVRVDVHDDAVAASIIDTGIGIAQNDLYQVFEPFYRGDTSRTRGIGSGTSGLGLAIVNDIVKAHSGSIIIRSALNRGTTIEITFPKAGTTNEPEEIIPSAEDDEYVATIIPA